MTAAQGDILRFEEIRAALAVVDCEGNIRRKNRLFGELFGAESGLMRLSEIKEQGFEEFLSLLETLESNWSGWVGMPRRWMDCYRMESDEPIFLLVVDPTNEKGRVFDRMVREVYEDSVTGLPGLKYVTRQIEKSCGGEEGIATGGALFFIAFDDVYRFDQFSHEQKEDRVLRQLAERLREFCRDGDHLAYLGNDTFVIFRPGIREVGEAAETARDLLHRNAEALAVDGELFYLNLAIGIALSPFDGASAAELVRFAEKAMREARQQGWNRYSFFHQLRPDTRIELLEQLRKALPEAIEREEIHFLYQPQYCLKSGRFTGAEMLVRWRHEEFGELSPELFLPLAEQSGMIRFITLRALTLASALFDRLRLMGREDFSLSVNLSPSAIFHRDFLENIQFFLDHYDLRGKPLNFEITENILAHNMMVMKETLSALKEMGVGIEVDDYGTGYASLTTLIDLPVDKVKIDRQYVRDIHRDPKVRTLYRAMVQTADALGLDVIAEGVEEAEEKETIASIGPVCIQGWYCARPLEEDALIELLASEG